MKHLISSLFIAASIVASANVLASELSDLSKKYNCVRCHTKSATSIGPSWTKISNAYRGNGKTSLGISGTELLSAHTAQELLVHKVSQGGAGVWGTIDMPPMDASGQLQKDITKLVQGVLSLSKGTTDKSKLLTLAKKYRCTSCHAIDQELLGPAWMDVSKAYNNNETTPYGVKVSDLLKSKTAAEYLNERISHGGVGNWGGNLMPAMEYVKGPARHDDGSSAQKHDDVERIVELILNISK